MSSPDLFDKKVIVAHIRHQGLPKRETRELIPGTFIVKKTEAQLRERAAKYEALHKHKRSFPPLATLARPEHILPIVSLPGPRKVQAFQDITKLWQQLNSPDSTLQEYERAVRKLDNVTGIVKSAVKQGDVECVAIQDFLENLDLSVGSRACGICLAPFQLGEKEGETTKVEILAPVSEFPILLPCCHIACYGCITNWLTARSTCPTCDMRFENVDELRKAMDLQVRQYDGELAEVLALL